jgi:hypothetical protein
MQRAQRTFGRFLKRTPNEADVEAMLSDFNDSESMLEKVCESVCKSLYARVATFCWLHRHEMAGSRETQQFPADVQHPKSASLDVICPAITHNLRHCIVEVPG